MTGARALALAVSRLRAAGVDDPARDARVLLANVLGIDRSRLTLVLQDEFAMEDAFESAIAARAARQPVAQIIGRREFYGREFIVTSDVLDPRPDTERLIEVALDGAFSSVLDLGTGSGCILLTLLAERDATGVGVDVSGGALDVAQRNGERLAVNASFVQSDWFAGVTGMFDLIVSNPPYITAAEMNDLSPEVANWEPRIALTPEGDGLDAYRIIAARAGDFLHPKGRLIVEIGPTQGAAVQGLMAKAGFGHCQLFQDMDGRDRVVLAQKR